MIKKKKTKGTPNEVDVHVGKRLRVRRSLLGLSQEKLAEAIGLTFQQIQKYEHGVNRISAGRLYQFSKILEIPVSYFFENIGGDTSQSSMAPGLSDNDQDTFQGQDVMNNKQTLELVRTFYAIEDDEFRKDVLKFVKSMVAAYKKDKNQ